MQQQEKEQEDQQIGLEHQTLTIGSAHIPLRLWANLSRRQSRPLAHTEHRETTPPTRLLELLLR